MLIWLGWILTAAMAALVAAELCRVTLIAPIFAMQAAPHLALAPALPLAVAATATGHPWMALANLPAVVWLGRWLDRRRRPVTVHAAGGTAPVTIAFANAWYENVRPADAVERLLATDADVLAIVEHTHDIATALEHQGGHVRYPHHVGASTDDRRGVALLSRLPLLRAEHRAIGDEPGIVATVATPAGATLRVIVVHPVAPVWPRQLRSWRRDLRRIGEVVATDEGPTIVVGDFNASSGHPAFRSLVRGAGLVAAHDALGRACSVSWPIHRIPPTFTRIDHALLRGLVPVALVDIDTPGSDHRGFVLTVAPALPQRAPVSRR